MYQIPPAPTPTQRILLIPAMLDDHFPLLQYAFHTPEYYPVVLENRKASRTWAAPGPQRHVLSLHPVLGPVFGGPDSGEYDPNRVSLLMPSAGDACRGSNFTSLIRKGLEAAGYGQVEVLTLNVKGLEKGQALPIRPDMVWRALFGLFYGDLLMLLTHQTRPYEREPGAARCLPGQVDGPPGPGPENRPPPDPPDHETDLFPGGQPTLPPSTGQTAPKKVALVGGSYTPNTAPWATGTWVAFLEGTVEVVVNGFSWYILYYASNQVAGNTGPARGLWRLAMAWGGGAPGCHDRGPGSPRVSLACPPFPPFSGRPGRGGALPLQVADGWLMGAEIAAHIHSGCHRVLAMQPFGCLPNHVCGRGQYAALVRRLGQGKVISVDMDASSPRLLVYNRVKLLLEGEP